MDNNNNNNESNVIEPPPTAPATTTPKFKRDVWSIFERIEVTGPMPLAHFFIFLVCFCFFLLSFPFLRFVFSCCSGPMPLAHFFILAASKVSTTCKWYIIMVTASCRVGGIVALIVIFSDYSQSHASCLTGSNMRRDRRILKHIFSFYFLINSGPGL